MLVSVRVSLYVCRMCVCVCVMCVPVCLCVSCVSACLSACLFVYVMCLWVCHVCVHQVEQYITGAENTSVRLGMLMEVCSTQVKEICNNT